MQTGHGLLLKRNEQTAGAGDSFDKRWRMMTVIDLVDKYGSMYAAEFACRQ